MTKSIFICVFLAGCTYRYGTRSFVIDNRTVEPASTSEPYPMHIPDDPPVVINKQVHPCKSENIPNSKAVEWSELQDKMSEFQKLWKNLSNQWYDDFGFNPHKG